MKEYKTGLLIGRFQPLHKGHVYLIKQALEKVDRLIIGVGSANIINNENPIAYQERKKILEIMLKKENVLQKIIKIIPLDDFYNDELWLKNVIAQSGDFEVVIGNNEWTNRILEKANYPVLRFGFYKRFLYEGEMIRKLIITNKIWEDRVPDYLIEYITKYMKSIKYKHLIIGGTFDHFHIGHRALIDQAFKYGENVSIGIVKENLLKNKMLSGLIEDYEVRKSSVVEYLKKMNFFDRVIIVPIGDIYGTTLTNKSIDSILVSKETYKNAQQINKDRKRLKMSVLKIIIAPNIYGDDGMLVSSERIRAGVINRQGENYTKIFDKKKQLFLPEKLREEMRAPIGQIFKGDDVDIVALEIIKEIKKIKPTMVISVGDVITSSLVDSGFNPDVKIIDNRSRRTQIRVTCNLPAGRQGAKRVTFKTIINKQGTINSKAVYEIKKAVDYNRQNNKSQTIVIDGEEDLLALPAILLAPLNSIVLYGQWNLGAVMVVVEEKIKSKILKLINAFTV